MDDKPRNTLMHTKRRSRLVNMDVMWPYFRRKEDGNANKLDNRSSLTQKELTLTDITSEVGGKVRRWLEDHLGGRAVVTRVRLRPHQHDGQSAAHHAHRHHHHDAAQHALHL